MTKVSIIIPTHNRADWLPGAIESAKLGCAADAEIIVVDDASSDATPKVCADIKGIRYERLDQNVGLARARNAGIRISTGEYLAFLDDDDRRLPGSLDLQIRALDESPESALVYGPVIWGDPETCEPTGVIDPPECPTGDVFWRLIEGNFIHVPSVVARKELVEKVGLFDTTVPGVEDWLLWLCLAAEHPVAAVSDPVAVYRMYNQSSGQLSSSRARMCTVSARVQQKALSFPRAQEVTAATRAKIRQRFLDVVSGMLVDEAATTFARSEYRLVIKDLFAAARLNPWKVVRPYTLRTLFSARASAKRRTGA